MVNQIVSISVAQYQLSELSVLLTAKLAVCVVCKCQCLVLPDADVCVRTCVSMSLSPGGDGCCISDVGSSLNGDRLRAQR